MMLVLRYKPTAQELFRNANGSELLLQYFKRRRHVVVADNPSSPFPDRLAFRTVEEARECWRQKRAEYRAMGYERSGD
jgi:hypothetical protein